MLHLLKIVHADPNALFLRCRESSVQIRFHECIENAARELGVRATRCVADRDITALEFAFYTVPKTIIRIPRSPLGWLSDKRFHALQSIIERCGYTTRDLS